MAQPLKTNPRRQQVSTLRQQPSAVKGWNTEYPLSQMPAGYAPLMLNMVPRGGYTEPRKGSAYFVAGFPAPVETLLVYRGDSGNTDRVFACAGSLITNVTVSASYGSSPTVASGFGNARFQYTNFANAADRWLVAVNGEDDPQKYDGSSFSTASIYSGSGASVTLDPQDLITVTGHKGRLYFGEKGSLRVWYLAPFAVQGEADLLDLGPVCTLGGSVAAVSTWSLDSGQGMDDMLVVVTDQGQYAIYQGTDPGDFTNWSLVGAFTAGKPLGRRCFQKYGGDLSVLTSDGVQMLSVMLSQDRARADRNAITADIASQFNFVAQRNAGQFGWQTVYYPEAGLAIHNIPFSGPNQQYVQNTVTGAWTPFKGWDALCFEVANGNLFYGALTSVVQAWTGFADVGPNGTTIPINYAQQIAWSDYGTYSTRKFFQSIRPLLEASYFVNFEALLLLDYENAEPTYPLTNIDDTLALWDSALWDTGVWAFSFDDPLEIVQDWQTVGGIGVAASILLSFSLMITVDTFQMRVISFDALYERGNPM